MSPINRIGPSKPVNRSRYSEVPNYEQGLYDLGNKTYAWIEPNGSWGESNAGLISDGEQSLLVDTLWDLNYTRRMLDAMGNLTRYAPIRQVVNTHADGDHFFGNELIDAEIVTSEKSRMEMEHTSPRAMVLLGRMGTMHRILGIFSKKHAQIGHYFKAMVAPYQFGAVKPKLPTRTFRHGITLQVGTRPVHLMEVGPAHTQGDLMVFVPDAKVLFSADILFIGSTPVMWAGPVTNWLNALDRILALDVETIVPGHGPITDKQGVEQVKAYWEFVADQVGERFRAGMSAEAAAQDIVLSELFRTQPFATWNSPERMMTNAHTIYRHLSGRTDAPKVRELLGIMRKQALLAHMLPQAQPQVMRKK